ncbi:uncharacterized protein C8R40DRAFT_1136925 [Lentinula edodes]|uniref:uncharacterized protein n=1 Tax=Lentinula edodes TaxID=5353 RepID=UPI001E8D0213|nr:uncharacterized protein C8R40DRAFT_1136925 [Lentinula edodes]KAH7867944.1 hypothetical protein C8R40DRAFT_1136925 [Lentinula edodes]
MFDIHPYYPDSVVVVFSVLRRSVYPLSFIHFPFPSPLHRVYHSNSTSSTIPLYPYPPAPAPHYPLPHRPLPPPHTHLPRPLVHINQKSAQRTALDGRVRVCVRGGGRYAQRYAERYVGVGKVRRKVCRKGTSDMRIHGSVLCNPRFQDPVTAWSERGWYTAAARDGESTCLVYPARTQVLEDDYGSSESGVRSRMTVDPVHYPHSDL